MTAVIAPNTIACPDCETGRCLCLNGCDACAGTGECPTCLGGQQVTRNVEPDNVKRVFAHCEVCKRGPKDFSVPDLYQGLETVEQRIEFSRTRHPRVNRPICAGCGRIFQDERVQGAVLAAAQGKLIIQEKTRVKHRILRVRPDCAGCCRRERAPSKRDPLATLSPEQRRKRLNAAPHGTRVHNAYRCSVCGQSFRLPLGVWARIACERGALLFFEPGEPDPIGYAVRPGDVTFSG